MKKKCGVVCHDAGGAELICRLLKTMNYDYLYSLKGPAIKIFYNYLGVVNNQSLDQVIRHSDLVICGTSWQSTHENEALVLAQEMNKKVISVIDHYAFYESRYIKNGFRIVPSEIWVTDTIAQNLAREFAPKANVKVIGNPYLYELKKEFAKFKISQNIQFNNFLYLFEPFSEQAFLQYNNRSYWNFDEYSAFSFFLQNIFKLTNSKDINIFIRPHPSEDPTKYQNLLVSKDNYKINLDVNTDLLLSMSLVDCVIGVDTIAMMLASELGIPTYSSLPNNVSYAPTIPGVGINYIRDIP